VEEAKIKENDQVQRSINNYLEVHGGLEKCDLVEMFINMADICAEECTHEIYETLALILDFISENKDSNSMVK
jgi:hypothetical protein